MTYHQTNSKSFCYKSPDRLGQIAERLNSKLITHLYEFFGSLLGCSSVGMSGFPAYAGDASMYKVHK